MYKAAVLISPEEIRIEEREEPSLSDNEVLIRVKFAGVCGTDIALFSGQYKVPLPLVLGHEFSGEIVAVGNKLDEELIGKSVVAEINNTCIAYRNKDLCEFCEIGLSNHCPRRTVLGIISSDGAFAELIKVPVGSVHVLPPEISLEEAVLVEPLAAAIQTFELTPASKGDTVAVLGVGRLGTLVCAVANALGARVIAISRSNWKLERAKNFGATEVINSSLDDPIKKIKDYTDGLGANIVVEATGTPDGLGLALELVRPRGTVALKTTCGVEQCPIDSTKAVVNEIRIQGSRCGPFEKAISTLKQREIPFQQLISHFYPLDKTKEAIATARTASKVLIDLTIPG
ncbi:MAG TPA: alcohol dehydrogenase catalytic domain-containing protein [Thermodesulfobacteriota bacterium]|nr:alcohol dehydrogenase catalytic domain-containing protein [Thermodesulfobacteriota bacterium]